MILALELRHFKTYYGKKYIPISNTNQRLSTFIGDNGIGKSSILEALDVLLNNREWNINLEARNAGGLSETARNQPYILGLFLIERKRIKSSGRIFKIFNDITELLRKQGEQYVFYNEIKKFESLDLEKAYFLVINGKQFNNNKIDSAYFASLDTDVKEIIQNNNEIDQDKLSSGNQQAKGKLERSHEAYFRNIQELYSYIYIPTEVSISEFTKIEKNDIQKLTGKNIYDEISKIISDKKLNDINNKLEELVEAISNELSSYKFKPTQHRNKKIQMQSLVAKIIEEFFSLRVLTKKSVKEEDIYVEYLSSGEKRKALIELSKAFLMTQQKNDKYIIFAVDEPEASLNRKARFKQFEELKQIKNISENIQLLVATHWYGHLSIIDNGASHLLYIEDNKIQINSYDLFNAREKINQIKSRNYKELPNDIALKSVNDLTQSIIVSLQAEEPYSWLICEGSSEKIYFDFYFKELVETHNLVILPVAGAKEVKRIFEYLELPFRDYGTLITGKVYCLIDTDKEKLNFSPNLSNNSRLVFYRLLNDNNATSLKENNYNINFVTEVEDCLNSKIFIETLMSFEDANICNILNTNNRIKSDEKLNSYFRLDLQESERKLIKNFFDANNGSHKIEFAKKYVEIANRIHHTVDWIEQIKKFFRSV